MFEGLPERCYYKDEINNKTILLMRGQSGYYPLGPGWEDRDPDDLNNLLGVTRGQAEAMSVGSMFGWNCPAADPNFYDEAGLPRCCK